MNEKLQLLAIAATVTALSAAFFIGCEIECKKNTHKLAAEVMSGRQSITFYQLANLEKFEPQAYAKFTATWTNKF